MIFRVAVLSVLASFGLSISHAEGVNGVDAVRMEYVPIDLPVKCDRLFFRSSSSYAGTIFMMPRVIASPGPNGTAAVESFDLPEEQAGSDERKKDAFLGIKLYFPTNDEYNKNFIPRADRAEENSCDLDEVKEVVDRIYPGDKIKTADLLPLTGIEVSIMGISESAVFGKADAKGAAVSMVDAIQYKNAILEANARVTTKELELFQKRALQPDGIPLTVKFTFRAKPRDGSVSIKIDTKNLEEAFRAAVNGKAMLNKAQIHAGLQAALAEKSRAVSIVTEMGTSEASQKDREAIITKIIGQLDFSAKDVKPEMPEANAKAEGSEVVSVDTVVRVMKGLTSETFSQQNWGRDILATAQTQIPLRVMGFGNTQARIVKLRAEEPEPSTGFVLLKDQTLEITALDWILTQIFYDRTRDRYLNEEDIKNLDLLNVFPNTIGDPDFPIENRGIRGRQVAYGWKSLGSFSWPTTYRWKRVRTLKRYDDWDSGHIATTEDTFRKLHIGLSIGVLGDTRPIPIENVFKFRDNFEQRGLFKIEFDEMVGTLRIKALRDLGAVQLRQMMNKRPAEGWDMVKFKRERGEHDMPDGDIKNEIFSKESPFVYDSVIEETRRYKWDKTWKQSASATLQKTTMRPILQKILTFSVIRVDDAHGGNSYAGTSAPPAAAAAPAWFPRKSSDPKPPGWKPGMPDYWEPWMGPWKRQKTEPQPDPQNLPDFNLNSIPFEKKN